MRGTTVCDQQENPPKISVEFVEAAQTKQRRIRKTNEKHRTWQGKRQMKADHMKKTKKSLNYVNEGVRHSLIQAPRRHKSLRKKSTTRQRGSVEDAGDSKLPLYSQKARAGNLTIPVIKRAAANTRRPEENFLQHYCL